MDDKDPTEREKMPPLSIAQTSTAEQPNIPLAGVGLESDLQSHIGRQLRAVYDEIVNEPVPDRFLRLLEELERQRTDSNE